MGIKCLSIQIQTDKKLQFDKEDFLRRVKSINRFPEIDEGEDTDLFLNFNFFTEMPTELWLDLKNALYDDEKYGPVIAAASVVVCEGDNGWDDYLLLHHYDKTENLDHL